MLQWKTGFRECWHSPVTVDKHRSINASVKDQIFHYLVYIYYCTLYYYYICTLYNCRFEPSPVYVDNPRYALVDFEKRGDDKLETGLVLNKSNIQILKYYIWSCSVVFKTMQTVPNEAQCTYEKYFHYIYFQ